MAIHPWKHGLGRHQANHGKPICSKCRRLCLSLPSSRQELLPMFPNAWMQRLPGAHPKSCLQADSWQLKRIPAQRQNVSFCKMQDQCGLLFAINWIRNSTFHFMAKQFESKTRQLTASVSFHLLCALPCVIFWLPFQLATVWLWVGCHILQCHMMSRRGRFSTMETKNTKIKHLILLNLYIFLPTHVHLAFTAHYVAMQASVRQQKDSTMK